MPLRGFVLLAAAAWLPSLADDRVREAASATYVHGMTAEIAEREAGRAAVPELLALLRDPEFPRRDNVVAFLAYLGGAESTAALRDLADDPPARLERPEDARARVLVPHALGRIAGRGDASALDALLRMTEREGPLREAAVAALAYAGTPAARERLRALAGAPAPPGVASAARDALAVMEEVRAGRAAATGPEAATPAPAVVDYIPDPASRSHAHAISFTNHVSLGNPMTTTRLEAVLAEASRRAARADYDGDVPCCTEVVRGGAGAAFGSAGDGLATIDSSSELSTVLSVSAGRAKVVTAINYCGAPGTNIIGCASTPGSAMILVRLSDLNAEAILWIHEYGHNLGLDHSGDSRNLMFASDNGANRGLLPQECQAFHTPSPGASAQIADAGTCTDDGDSYGDPIDNCPLVENDDQGDSNGNGIGNVCEGCPAGGDTDSDGVCNATDNCPSAANSNQADVDLDGVGDVCDNCPATANGGQANADGDELGDVCDACPADTPNNPDGDAVCSSVDNCPGTSNAGQADFDADGFGDPCETGALLADSDLSGLVDGADLARLGRAFGSTAGDGRYDARVDYDRDGQIDGADLAILAANFGETSL